MNEKTGRLLAGNAEILSASFEEFSRIPVDLDLTDQPSHPPRTQQKTIAEQVSVSGPGTFTGKSMTTITFEPTDREGWWLDRTDQPNALPIRVAIDNVWTTGSIVSNIVLRPGALTIMCVWWSTSFPCAWDWILTT